MNVWVETALTVVGLLAHYSAAVFLPGAAIVILWKEFRLRDFRGSAARLLPGATAGAIILFLWLGWAASVFGLSESMAFTPTSFPKTSETGSGWLRKRRISAG